MYFPKHYEESDITVLHALIKSEPLGAWVTASIGVASDNDFYQFQTPPEHRDVIEISFQNRSTSLDLPYRAQARRVRIRHVGERFGEAWRQRRRLGAAHAR